MRAPRNRDLLFVAALAVICAILTAAVDVSAIRIPAGLILELLLPGYALGALALPRRDLSVAERLLLTVGGSLALTALGGLLLDALPGHMGRVPWAILLAAVTLIAATAAIITPSSGSGDSGARAVESADAQHPTGEGREWFLLRWARAFERWAQVIGNVALAVLALGLAIVAVAVARHAADRVPAFTELSALPSPTHPRRLGIELTSHEGHPVTFNLIVREDGRLIASSHILLDSGHTYRSLTPAWGSHTRRVTVVVKREGSSKPYLHTVYYPHGRPPKGGKG
jgi:Protein of unknown function (DUF1616)